MSRFQFGNVLRLSDSYIASIPTAYRDRRVMYLWGEREGTQVVVLRADSHEDVFSKREVGTVTFVTGQVWQVCDEPD